MKTLRSSQHLSGGTGDVVRAHTKGSFGSCAMGGAYLTAENLKSYKFTAYQVHQWLSSLSSLPAWTRGFSDTPQLFFNSQLLGSLSVVALADRTPAALPGPLWPWCMVSPELWSLLWRGDNPSREPVPPMLCCGRQGLKRQPGVWGLPHAPPCGTPLAIPLPWLCPALTCVS